MIVHENVPAWVLICEFLKCGKSDFYFAIVSHKSYRHLLPSNSIPIRVNDRRVKKPPSITLQRMEQHVLRIVINIRTARPTKPIITRDIQRTRLRERTRRTAGIRITDIVVRRRVAIAAEEQDVVARGVADHARRLDVRPVGGRQVQDVGLRTREGHAVGPHRLDVDWCVDDGRHAVVAHAAVSVAVGVDFVRHVSVAVGVFEADGVDCAALGGGAEEGRRRGGVGAADVSRGRAADAVVAWCCGVGGAEVHYERAVVLGVVSQ